MVQLHQDRQLFAEKNIQIVVICPENTEKIAAFTSKQPLDFTLVADPKHVIADHYNQQFKLLKLGRMPAQLLFDQSGKRLFEHYANSMSDIVENQAVLAKL